MYYTFLCFYLLVIYLSYIFFFISVADSMIFSWDGNQRYVNIYVNISIYTLRKWYVNLVCKFFLKNGIWYEWSQNRKESPNFLLIL